MLFESDYEKRQRERRETYEFFFGPLDEPWTLAQRARHFARVCVSLYAGYWSAYYLAKLGLGPPLSLLEGVSSPIAVVFWLVRFILFIVWWAVLAAIGFGIVSWIVSSIESVKARLLTYVVVLVALPLPSMLLQSRATKTVEAAPPVEVERPDVGTVDPPATPSFEAMREKHRATGALVTRIEKLLDQRAARWRSDLEQSGSTGPPGAVPDFLEVRQAAGHHEVTNSTDTPVCVLVARVAPSATAEDGFERCVVGSRVCREIAAHGTARFQEFRSSPPQCATASFEFRVGSPERPEPSWWSQSALAELDAIPPAPSRSYPADEQKLAARIAELETELADTGRAERWRQRRQR